ncbi:hypothetical protein HMPREF0762_00494 [Slackia exigua ATCC 700122]|uniref:Uncharacterized protein n=1 Tax=Slackia exigua (strain ATCC 700122 / DSM 15923 / CIP 105133 / JCM 11022 / KCTC 5966 / S-7) TaxID=649764 RepID=D0WFH6_SLAES|nr:hypothetical protein HMPREF0762_00494 [Slackia exigua ATCC 700122]
MHAALTRSTEEGHQEEVRLDCCGSAAGRPDGAFVCGVRRILVA